MSKKFYTPNIAKPQTASVGEFKPVGLESDAIIQRVSKDLYASPASGVRELLANEIRAAVEAKEAGADPRIEVTIQPDMIRVWGTDSLGMERDVFENVYMTLGRSSNFDGSTPGQFGLGRAAYVTISDHILLETRHRNGDCYSVLGVEGRGYQTGLQEPDIPFGTRVTMAPRNPPTDAMVAMVRRTAERSPIPITLITGDGTEELRQVPLAEGDNCITADLPELEMAVNPHGWATPRAYLCGIPIEFRYGGTYPLHNISIDIHDERKFPPTPDRERMTEKAEKDISYIMDREIDKRLAGFPYSVVEALDHPDLPLARRFLAGHRTVQVLERYVPVLGEHAERLANITARPILNCRSFNPRQIDAVRKVHPDAVFVKKVDELPYITNFMRENKIKADPVKPKAKAAPTSVAVHRYYRAPTRIDPQNPPKGMTIYRVASGNDLYNHPILQGHESALTIHDVQGAVDMGAAKRAALARTYQTSRGRITGQELVDADVEVFPVERASLLECWGDGPYDVKSVAITRPERREYAELACNKPGWFMERLQPDVMGRDERVIEAYLRLENPLFRRILRARPTNHGFCDEFLAAEGKSLCDGPTRPAKQKDKPLSPARTRTFKTSRGEMTGQEILDARLVVYPVTQQSLADVWGDGPDAGAPSLAVIIDNTDGDYRWLADRFQQIKSYLHVAGLGCDERVIESYLRLENPTFRRVLLANHGNHDFCDEMLAAEGKEPATHPDDCVCDKCY